MSKRTNKQKKKPLIPTILATYTKILYTNSTRACLGTVHTPVG